MKKYILTKSNLNNMVFPFPLRKELRLKLYFFNGSNKYDNFREQVTFAKDIWKINISDMVKGKNISNVDYPITENDFKGNTAEILNRTNIKNILSLSSPYKTIGDETVVRVFFIPLDKIQPNADGMTLVETIRRGDMVCFRCNIFISNGADPKLLGHEIGHTLFCGNSELKCNDPDNPKDGNTSHHSDINNLMYPTLYSGPSFPVLTGKQIQVARSSFFYPTWFYYYYVLRKIKI